MCGPLLWSPASVARISPITQSTTAITGATSGVWRSQPRVLARPVETAVSVMPSFLRCWFAGGRRRRALIRRSFGTVLSRSLCLASDHAAVGRPEADDPADLRVGRGALRTDRRRVPVDARGGV